MRIMLKSLRNINTNNIRAGSKFFVYILSMNDKISFIKTSTSLLEIQL